METAVLVLVGSVALGAASAFVLSAVGMFFGTLLLIGAVFVVPEPARPDAWTVIGSVVLMQATFVATGWLRSR